MLHPFPWQQSKLAVMIWSCLAVAPKPLTQHSHLTSTCCFGTGWLCMPCAHLFHPALIHTPCTRLMLICTPALICCCPCYCCHSCCCCFAFISPPSHRPPGSHALLPPSWLEFVFAFTSPPLVHIHVHWPSLACWFLALALPPLLLPLLCVYVCSLTLVL